MDPFECWLREEGNQAVMPITTWLRWLLQHHSDTFPMPYASLLFTTVSAEDSLWMTLMLGVLVTQANGPTMPWSAWTSLWTWITRAGGWQTGFLWTALLNASCSDVSVPTDNAPAP